jgi:hypothetical protein
MLPLTPAPSSLSQALHEVAGPVNIHTTRFMGVVTGTVGNTIMSVTGDGDLTAKGRKKMLKAGAASWAAVAAQTLYNTETGISAKEFGYPTFALAAMLSGLSLWRGLKDVDAKEE